MIHYADSSFLVSCYVVDANTAQAKTWLSNAGVPLVFTALHALEVRNAFKLGLFRGFFPAADATAAWANLESDLRSGRLIKTPADWPVAFRVAARLSEAHSALIGARSLDILHVAIAKTLRLREVVSFDVRQRTLASAVGMNAAS
jgi:predicted nucleic acid-binding protein